MGKEIYNDNVSAPDRNPRRSRLCAAVSEGGSEKIGSEHFVPCESKGF